MRVRPPALHSRYFEPGARKARTRNDREIGDVALAFALDDQLRTGDRVAGERLERRLELQDARIAPQRGPGGGLADIEFLIDFWVLASSDTHPELVTYPDNVRQLEALEAARLVPAEHCRRLKEAYLTLRKRTHELALAEAGRVVAAAEFAELRGWVVARWREVFGPDPED